MTPTEDLHRDYQRLSRFLRGIGLRLQLRAGIEFLFLFLSALGFILAGSLSAFELREHFVYYPLIYSLFAALSLLLLLIFGFRRFLKAPSQEALGRFLEKKFPRLRDDITNSLALYHEAEKPPRSGQISKSLISAQLRKTAQEVEALKAGQVVSFRAVLRHLKILLPSLIAFLLVVAFDPHFLDRSFALLLRPLSNLPVKTVTIKVEPQGAIVLRQSALVIRAEAEGDGVERLFLTLWTEGSEPLRLQMAEEKKGRFSHRIPSVLSSFHYQVSAEEAKSPIYAVRVVDPPDVKALRVHLAPPPYSQLQPETREGGDFEALLGTTVNLEVEATKEVKEGKIALGEKSEILLQVRGNRLKGSLPVFSASRYLIKLRDEHGFENPNPAQYSITIIPDQSPEVELISPAKDLEVTGREVLPLVYQARDDFGLTAIKLSYQMGGLERSIMLKSLRDVRSIDPETFKWDLAHLTLTAGDRVTYRIEAWDNDTVSGPKAGYSRSFVLSVRDERAQMAQEGEEAHRIADALLELLADHLEAIRDREALKKGMEEILERVERILSEMGERLERFDLEALKRNLSSLRDRIDRESHEKVTQEMERLALLAEEIAKRARMDEVEALAREMRNRQRRLAESIQQLKEQLTREGLEAAMKELRKVEELLRSLIEALSKSATALPDEFMNNPEIAGLDFQDLFKDLEEMARKLSAGDVEGALEAAQRLLQTLSEMLASLGRARAQAGLSPFDRLQGEMSRQAGELEKILREQRQIFNETEGVERQIRQQSVEETGRRLARQGPRLKEILGKLKSSLEPEQQDWIDELGKALRKGDVEELSKMAETLERNLFGKASEIDESLEALRTLRRTLRPKASDLLTPFQKERLGQLSSRQGDLKERTNRLNERLEALAQLFPGMDTEILNDLREAATFMAEASDKLGERNPSGAIPPEQEAIRRLAKSQQAMEQMAQQMAMRMQAARYGYPWAYDPRAGWYYGPWIPMPTLPQPEFNRPRERGMTGIDREEFETPSKDAYKVPKRLREKVLDALKEGVPPEYKRDVERYFRGLTK